MIYTRIKDIANERKVSIRSIERELGFSNGAISKWNNVNPSVTALKRVADYLQVDINVLLEDKNLNRN